MKNLTFKNATRPAVPPADGDRAAHGAASGGEKRSDEGAVRSKYFLILPSAPGEERRSEGQNEAQNMAPLDSGSITFVGTATVIIRYAGLTILTDPNFLHAGDHVHLGYRLTSKRLTNPAIELQNLPPIDLIVLSHMHEDHFDRYVQKNLDRNIPIVTTTQAVEILEGLGFLKLYPLETWETFTVEKGDAALSITSMPGRHGPPVVAKLLPEVMGSILDFANKGRPGEYRMYISGDTMVFNDINQIPKRYPGVDLALLHLGGTKLLGLVTVTMNGKDGVEMMRIIVPEKAIPIHYNDYDVFKSPLSDFEKEMEQAGLKDKIIYLKHGDQYEFHLHDR
ncbi:MAG TPA: MBL fold metallo-hydrolase [Nitrosospira sp.]|nr:MBL fold metallo-hydrolase [Nitrosospira sp.]